jgi:hypothetical protein
MHVLLEASPPTLSLTRYVTLPKNNISHIQVLVTNIFFLPTPPIKLKLGLQVGARLLIANHLDQSNYLPNQKQGSSRIHMICVCLLRFFRKAPSPPTPTPWLWKAVHFFKSPMSLLDWGTSSQISSAGSHTEHCWRCSSVGDVCVSLLLLLLLSNIQSISKSCSQHFLNFFGWIFSTWQHKGNPVKGFFVKKMCQSNPVFEDFFLFL